MKNKMRMGPLATFLASPATLNHFDNPANTTDITDTTCCWR